MSLQDSYNEAAQPCSTLDLCTDGASGSLTPVEKGVDAEQRDIQPSCPIDTLSAELLLEIFSLSSMLENWPITLPYGTYLLPWVLGRVCSKWRALSRAETHLWGSIRITINRKGCPVTPEEVARFFEVLPPSVLVAFRFFCPNDVKRYLAPHLSRCHCLKIYGTVDLYEELLGNLPQNAFANLCEVAFGLESPGMNVEKLAVWDASWASTASQWAMADNLHTVSFACDTLDPEISMALLSIPLPWHQIETFQTVLFMDNDPSVLWAYLRKCRGIFQLNLKVRPGCLLDALPGPSIDLPDLCEVNIFGPTSPNLLPEHSWRNLTTLELSCSDVDEGEIRPEPHEVQRILQLCTYLEVLIIKALAFDNRETFPVIKLQLPFLLSLSVLIEDEWSLNACLIHAPALEDLNLRGSPADLLDAAKAFHKSLTHVWFYNTKVEDTTPKQLRDILSVFSPTTKFIDNTPDMRYRFY
ncbi:hypothetical protein H0H92_011609 [Tricholoma furcatifolium]|nr:hypothetical protein H0H92_011609 [Tricholoma furcatifolium]